MVFGPIDMEMMMTTQKSGPMVLCAKLPKTGWYAEFQGADVTLWPLEGGDQKFSGSILEMPEDALKESLRLGFIKAT